VSSIVLWCIFVCILAIWLRIWLKKYASVIVDLKIIDRLSNNKVVLVQGLADDPEPEV
jgi:hypothetical protein